jgi:hypothetical protein
MSGLASWPAYFASCFSEEAGKSSCFKGFHRLTLRPGYKFAHPINLALGNSNFSIVQSTYSIGWFAQLAASSP